MSPILPARLDWPSAIGNFLLNFGVLDWLVNVFLERRMTPQQFAKIGKEHFQDRVVRIQKLIATGGYSPEQQHAFAQLFTRLDSVRKLRNHLAHGHMLLQIRDEGRRAVLSLTLPRDLNATGAAERRHLDLKYLTQALSELALLIEDFQTITGDWRSQRIGV